MGDDRDRLARVEIHQPGERGSDARVEVAQALPAVRHRLVRVPLAAGPAHPDLLVPVAAVSITRVELAEVAVLDDVVDAE